MRYQPSVFEEVLQPLSWPAFDRLVAHYQADRRSRDFDSRNHLLAMLGSALGGLQGLRQTVAGLQPGRGPLRLLGHKTPSRSTLSEANQNRPAALFMDLLQTLVGTLQRSQRRDMADAIRLIDSTQINLVHHVIDIERIV